MTSMHTMTFVFACHSGIICARKTSLLTSEWCQLSCVLPDAWQLLPELIPVT